MKRVILWWCLISCAACGSRSVLDIDGFFEPDTTRQPAPPRNVRASRELVDHVRVSFDPPLQGAPSGYRVLRDDVVIADLPRDARSYEDTSALAGSIDAPSGLTASQGTSESVVELSWVPPDEARAGRDHTYRVVTLEGELPSAPSTAVEGARAAPEILHYEVSRDGGRSWFPTGSQEPAYADRDAPPGVIEVGQASAESFLVPEGAVRLQVQGSTLRTAEFAYRVRARTTSGVSSSSDSAVGYRKLPALDYQWQRSQGAKDADYADLPGVTGPSWVDASLPPSTTHYYRAVVRAGPTLGANTAGVMVTTQPPVIDASRDDSTCAVTEPGDLQCWGSSSWRPRLSTLPDEHFTKISIAYGSVCALRTDQRMRCWGAAADVPSPPGPSSTLYTEVSRASAYICSVRSADKRVECTGWYGSYEALPTPPEDSFTKVATASQRMCGLRTDGRLRCWGKGSYGPSEPTADRFLAVYLDSWRVVAVRADGQLLIWDAASEPVVLQGESGERFTDVGGNFVLNHRGRLSRISGNREAGYLLTPVPGPSYRDMVDECAIRSDGKLDCLDVLHASALPIATPASHLVFGDRMCVLDANQRATCLGARSPLLGISEADLPAQFKGLVSTPSTHPCVLHLDGLLQCFPSPYSTTYKEVLLPEGERYLEVAASEKILCGIREDGRLRCVVRQQGAQVMPESLSAERFTQLVAGNDHICALRDGGVPMCWGDGAAARVPAEASAQRVRALTAGYNHTCTLHEDGVLSCWGENADGQAPRFREASGLSALAAGTRHTCGLQNDGHIICWGNNEGGQAPGVPTLGEYTKVYAHRYSTCGLRNDGKAVCWGAGFQGQDSAPLVTP